MVVKYYNNCIGTSNKISVYEPTSPCSFCCVLGREATNINFIALVKSITNIEQSMKSHIKHINIYSFHLISEMFTIYLPFRMASKLALNFCYYQSEYKLTNCTMSYSKVNTLHVHAYLYIK